ncbi:MAG TPA: hypothetical protein VE992_05230 [Solirubrobacteraceae bacterium]|nr:hypothetical protein [Solirubrobacteraceae bacterium]
MDSADLRSELVAAAVRELGPVIGGGLPDGQRAWALRTFRDDILPERLGFVDRVPESESRRRAAQVVSDLSHDLSGLAPAEKWSVVCALSYWARLAPLQSRAHALAIERYYGWADREAGVEARAIAMALDDLSLEVERGAPELLQAMEEEISEVALDCGYAVAGSGPVSLRTGWFLRHAQGA